jgi:hypothetical protein
MCHPPSLYPEALEAWPAKVGGELRPDIYDFRFRYAGSPDWQHVLGVYVPKVVQAQFVSGELAGFNLAHLELNSTAALSFDCQPQYVVMAVESRNRARFSCVPANLLQTYWRHIRNAGLWAALGVATAWAWSSLIVAAAIGAAVWHQLNLAKRVPRKPSWSTGPSSRSL